MPAQAFFPPLVKGGLGGVAQCAATHPEGGWGGWTLPRHAPRNGALGGGLWRRTLRGRYPSESQACHGQEIRHFAANRFIRHNQSREGKKIRENSARARIVWHVLLGLGMASLHGGGTCREAQRSRH